MRKAIIFLALFAAVCASAQVKFGSGVKLNQGVRISAAQMAQQVPSLAQPIVFGGTGATFTQANKAGNLIAVIAGWYGASADLASGAVDDSAGNTYEVGCAATTTSDNAMPRQAIYFAKNIAAYASNAVTVHWGATTPSSPGVRILEFNGLDQTAPFDACSAVAGTYTGSVQTTVATNTVSTAVVTELLVGGGTTTWAFAAPGVNYQGQVRSGIGDLAEYRVVQAQGSYPADGVLTGHTQNWVMSLAAFKAAGQTVVQPPATVTSILPTSGTTAGGTFVSIAGTNFLGAATVDFGGAAAASVNVVSSASITAVTPAHAAGLVDVTVTIPGAPPAILSGAFTYNAVPVSTDRYISPSGSDSNSGLDTTHPWRTISYAVQHVPAGGTIHAADGTYAPGLINCSTGATQGTSVAPLTLVADNERQAFIQGDGSKNPLQITNCNYWTIQGFRLQDGDWPTYTDGIIGLLNTDHITVRHNLLRRTNRNCNATAIGTDGASNTIVEENEIYEYHKHGIIFYYGGTLGPNIARRNYLNSRGYADCGQLGGPACANAIPACMNFVSEDPLRGDQAVQIYAESNDVIENNVSQGQYHGFEVRPGGTGRADNNKFYGNIVLDDPGLGFTDQANSGAGTQTQDDAHMPHGTLYKHNVCAPGYNATACFSSESAKATNLDHNTAITLGGVNGYQIIRHDDNGGDGLYSASFTRDLAMAWGSNIGFYAYTSAGTITTAGSYINAYGYATAFDGMNVVTNQTQVDPQIAACLYWRPDGSWAKTNDIGADILYRYDNGSLTNVPLWDANGKFPGGAVIAGWNDATTNSLIGITANRNCPFPASYPVGTVSRILQVTASGGGTIASSPAGINCTDTTCSANFNQGTVVTLTASYDDTNVTFDGWSGEICTGTGSSCVFTMDANKSVGASFTLKASAIYTLADPPPYTWSPYVACGVSGANGERSIFNCSIPGNFYDGDGSIVNHCYGNTSACGNSRDGSANARSIAAYSITWNGECTTGGDCGFWMIRDANNSADQGYAVYYSTASDPWYKYTGRGFNVYFHAPQQATFSGGGSGTDEYIMIFDQAQKLLISSYVYGHSYPWRLPYSGCAGNQDKSCAQDVGGAFNYTTAAKVGDSDFNNHKLYTSSEGYTIGDGGASGLGTAPSTGQRLAEEAAGVFNHSGVIVFRCGYPTYGAGHQSGYIWPADSGLLACSSTADARMPMGGMLVMADYTKAQIDSMGLDPLNKGLLVQMSKYGDWFMATNGSGNPGRGFTIPGTGGWESQAAYAATSVALDEYSKIQQDNPNWLTCTTGSNVTGKSAYNTYCYGGINKKIPRMVCPEGAGNCPGRTDWNNNSCNAAPGCGLSGHVLVVDPCVMKAKAGVAGGCQ